MSFNYIIPPRLKASDYAKGKITQDELIALQIANDANIASARKAIKLGEVQQLTPQQQASPDELLADDASQEATARANLGKLGFRDQEAAQIITNIRNDADLTFPVLNANFPAIEADIKKRFNVKLLTPAFFLEYLRKYSDELAGAAGMRVFQPHNGGFNSLVNTVSELRQVIPDINVIKYIKKASQDSKVISQDILDELDRLIDLIPSQTELQSLERLPAVEQQRIIDDLLTQFESFPSNEEIRKLASQIQSGQLDKRRIQTAVTSLVDAIPQGKQENVVAREIKAVPAEASQEEEFVLASPVKATKVFDENNIKSLRDYQDLKVKDKYSFLKQSGLNNYIRYQTSGKKLTDTQQRSRLDLEISNVLKVVEKWLEYKSVRPSLIERVKLVYEPEFDALVGGQPLTGRGAPIHPKIRMKVGKGLAVKETPSYREYGKYAIHIPQLEQHDILNVKYKSLGQVPKFKPIAVSDIFRDFILDLLENGKPNSRVYSQISPEERKYFEEMSIGAGVWNGLGLKRTTTSSDEEEARRFELLKGELMAGNDNPKVVSELRRLVVKMMSDGRIRKSQGIDLLMELSI